MKFGYVMDNTLKSTKPQKSHFWWSAPKVPFILEPSTLIFLLPLFRSFLALPSLLSCSCNFRFFLFLLLLLFVIFLNLFYMLKVVRMRRELLSWDWKVWLVSMLGVWPLSNEAQIFGGGWTSQRPSDNKQLCVRSSKAFLFSVEIASLVPRLLGGGEKNSLVHSVRTCA